MIGLLNRRVGAVSFALMAATSPLLAQDSVQKIKDLYASAAYEETLSAVTSLGAVDPKPEVEQYRVFSLVALGRVAEAEQVVEAVLRAQPRYRPEPSEASPRIQELFAKVRGRIGPDVVKALYGEAKAALERKDRAAAITLFGEMVAAADDPDIKGQGSVAELRLLGAGFLELSKALPAGASGAPSPVASAEPPTVSGSSPQANLPVAITGPIAIRQALPAWPPSMPLGNREFTGTVRVMIAADGTVESAEILSSVHPIYDPVLLKAAKGWLYEPARRNGVALPSEKSVTVHVKPPA
jgi:TonB family protein